MKLWDEYKWNIWDPIKEPLPGEIKDYKKITICTTCMNRTYDLKSTYIKNLEICKKYPNIDCVLLNYNSKDDLDDFVQNELQSYIDSGLLNYYKTTEPEFYEMGHSRNIAFKLGNGDIVNNIDADNYLQDYYIKIINLLAQNNNDNTIFVKGKRMMHGVLGIYKSKFLELGGYDEDLSGYGYDDHDLVNRFMALGGKMMWWCNLLPINRIKTKREEKSKNMKIKDWKISEDKNKEISLTKLKNKEFIANKNKSWGVATLLKNFKETIHV
jgi:hypothetical protein